MKKILLITILVALTATAFFIFKKDEEKFYYGNIDVKSVELSFRFAEEISSFAGDEGDSFKAGDEVARLKTDYLENSLNEINAKIAAETALLDKLKKGYRSEDIAAFKAQLEVAKANESEANDVFIRQKALKAKNATSEQSYQNALNTLKSANASVKLASANLNKAQNGYEKEDIKAKEAQIAALIANKDKIALDIQNAVLKAPFDSIMIKRYKEPGALVAPNEVIAELLRTDSHFVRAYIDEKNLGKIKLGDTLLVHTDLKPEPYHAKITFISSSAEFTPKNIQTIDLRPDLVYRFKAEILDADQLIKQGIPVHLSHD